MNICQPRFPHDFGLSYNYLSSEPFCIVLNPANSIEGTVLPVMGVESGDPARSGNTCDATPARGPGGFVLP